MLPDQVTLWRMWRSWTWGERTIERGRASHARGYLYLQYKKGCRPSSPPPTPLHRHLQLPVSKGGGKEDPNFTPSKFWQVIPSTKSTRLGAPVIQQGNQVYGSVRPPLPRSTKALCSTSLSVLYPKTLKNICVQFKAIATPGTGGQRRKARLNPSRVALTPAVDGASCHTGRHRQTA